MRWSDVRLPSPHPRPDLPMTPAPTGACRQGAQRGCGEGAGRFVGAGNCAVVEGSDYRMMGLTEVNLGVGEAQAQSGTERRCVYPPCGRSLTGRQKLYCSDSHSVLTCLLRKKDRQKAARLLRRQLPRRDPLWPLDFLPVAERRAMFAEAAAAMVRKSPW